MEGRRSPRQQQERESGRLGAVLGWMLASVALVAVLIIVGGNSASREQSNRELLRQCRQIDNTNRELEKEIGNCLAELERLKDGRNITRLAMEMKLRPPDETQNVLRFRVVRTAEGNRFEQVVGYNIRK